MMISNLKTRWFLWFIQKYFSASRIKGLIKYPSDVISQTLTRDIANLDLIVHCSPSWIGQWQTDTVSNYIDSKKSLFHLHVMCYNNSCSIDFLSLWLPPLFPTQLEGKQTDLTLYPWRAGIFLYKAWMQKFFSIWNHHKCLTSLFLIHLNTYVMGLLLI